MTNLNKIPLLILRILQSVEKTIKEIFEIHSGINVCINNAGIIHSEPLVNILSPTDKKHKSATGIR